MDQKREPGDGECGEENISQQGAVGKPATKSDWKVNQALLEELISLGIDKNTAKKAIYYTSVDSAESNVEKCMDFIFTNPNPIELSKTTLEEELGLEEVYQLCPELSLDDQSSDDYKMVFVINKSLNMSLGKSCSQTAHAAFAMASEIVSDRHINGYQNWILTGQAKIVLAGNSTRQLEELKEKAESLGLANQLIEDAGRTEIPSGSKTVLAIFGSIRQVDKLTGKLKLLK